MNRRAICRRVQKLRRLNGQAAEEFIRSLIINTLESPAQSGVFVVCFRRLDETIKAQSRFAGRVTDAG